MATANTKKRCKTCSFSPCRCDDLADGHIGQGHLPACWPQKSTALAVHPSQRKEAHEDARKKGVPTEFSRSGQPIFTDRNHRKQYMRAYGFFDRSGGYSDAQRGSFDGKRGPTEKELREMY